jgi:hypothetical protein
MTRVTKDANVAALRKPLHIEFVLHQQGDAMRAPVIRISLGFFDTDKAPLVEAKLAATRQLLEPGVKALRGNLGYFAGIDRVNNTMHNVSFWESVEDANQMAAFPPMLALATEFIALGVRFQRPILNFETVWSFNE